MGYNLRVVQVDHSLKYIGHEGGDEHVVQVQIFVGQHVLQTATCTVSGEDDHGSVIRGRSNEVDNILMSHLKE